MDTRRTCSSGSALHASSTARLKSFDPQYEYTHVLAPLYTHQRPSAPVFNSRHDAGCPLCKLCPRCRPCLRMPTFFPQARPHLRIPCPSDPNNRPPHLVLISASAAGQNSPQQLPTRLTVTSTFMPRVHSTVVDCRRSTNRMSNTQIRP
jgi:hypothetical protein